jgi:hypothetical protein
MRKTLTVLVVCLCLIFSQVACTSAQISKVVSEIIAYAPTAISLASEILSVVSAFTVTDPATAKTVGQVGTDVTNGLNELVALCQDYQAKPTTGTWQQITALVDSLVQETDAQLLQVVDIKDPATQTEVKLALGALDTALHLIDGYTSTAQSSAAVQAKARARVVKLQQIKSYLSPAVLPPGIDFNRAMAYQIAQGF